MSPTSQEDMLRKIIQQGMSLLHREFLYTQAIIVCKLGTIEHKVSRSAFSQILNGKNTGINTLSLVAEGMQKIVAKELGMEWVKGKFVRTAGKNFNSDIIPCYKDEAIKTGFKFHEKGRLEISEKVAFFKSAQNEVIEFGVTLNTFTNYFISRNDDEFKKHIIDLLKKGVNFKCYLLNPDCNEGSIYFEDRRKIQKEEIYPSEKIKRVIEKLKIIHSEFNAADYPGQFEVYTYRHIPYNYFMVVDGNKMMVSHYLYGLPRAKAPVIEFTKKNKNLLFRRYYESMNHLINGAKKIIPQQ